MRAKATTAGQMSPTPSSSEADDDSETDGLENTNVRLTFGSPSRSPLAPNISSSGSITAPSAPLFTTPSILRKRSRLASQSPGSSDASPAKRNMASMPPPAVPQFFSPQLPRTKKSTHVLSTPAPRSSLDSLLAASNLDASLSQQHRQPMTSGVLSEDHAVNAIPATPPTASASLSALATLSLHTPNVVTTSAQLSAPGSDSNGDPARRSLASTFLSMPGGEEDGDDSNESSKGSTGSTANRDASYLSPPRPTVTSLSSTLSPNSSITAGAAVLLASLSDATTSTASDNPNPTSPSRSLVSPSQSKLLPSVLSNLLTPPRMSPRDREATSNLSFLGGGFGVLGSAGRSSAVSSGGSNVSREFYSPAQQLLAGPLVERDPLCAQAERVLINAAIAAKDRKTGDGSAWKRRDVLDVMALKAEVNGGAGASMGTSLHTIV